MRKYDLKLSGISFYYSFAVLTDTESYFANTIIDYRGEARTAAHICRWEIITLAFFSSIFYYSRDSCGVKIDFSAVVEKKVNDDDDDQLSGNHTKFLNNLLKFFFISLFVSYI